MWFIKMMSTIYYEFIAVLMAVIEHLIIKLTNK